MVDYSPNLCVTIALEGITCRQAITIVHGLWLGETDGFFSSMIVFKTHFNTMDAGQQECSLQLSNGLISTWSIL